MYKGPTSFAFSVRLYRGGMQQNYIDGGKNPSEPLKIECYCFLYTQEGIVGMQPSAHTAMMKWSAPAKPMAHFYWASEAVPEEPCLIGFNLLPILESCLVWNSLRTESEANNLDRERKVSRWVQKIKECRRRCYTVLPQKYGLTGWLISSIGNQLKKRNNYNGKKETREGTVDHQKYVLVCCKLCIQWYILTGRGGDDCAVGSARYLRCINSLRIVYV